MIADKIQTLIENNKYEEAITLLKDLCVGPLIVFRTQVVIFSSELNQYRQNVFNSVDEDIEINRLRLNLLTFANELDKHTSEIEPNKIKELISTYLLMEDSFAFIDRSAFRAKIEKSLASDKADVILVSGKPKSGMSYLEKFLNNTSNNLDIVTFIPIEIPAILGDPDIILGEKLAKFILNELAVEIKFNDEENEQFKFKQFINILKSQLRKEKKVPIFFLHDFHKIEDNNDNLLSFIFTLISSLKNDFPKCLFIIAGLNYENMHRWKSELRFSTPVYTIEDITVEHVRSCLDTIFTKYENKIKTIPGFDNINKDEYIEGMIGNLIQDSNAIDISAVGLGLAEHLLVLKD